jgi:hypothetical protein
MLATVAMSDVHSDALTPLIRVLEERMLTLHAKERGKETKPPYLQALVEFLVAGHVAEADRADEGLAAAASWKLSESTVHPGIKVSGELTVAVRQEDGGDAGSLAVWLPRIHPCLARQEAVLAETGAHTVEALRKMDPSRVEGVVKALMSPTALQLLMTTLRTPVEEEGGGFMKSLFGSGGQGPAVACGEGIEGGLLEWNLLIQKIGSNVREGGGIEKRAPCCPVAL